MVDETLPPEFEFGKVVGRAIHAIADTAEDVDDKPQARPAAGTVTFTPRDTLRVVTTPGYKSFVAAGPEKATLSATGRILDAEGRNGIWLVAGVYDVTFQLTAQPGLTAPKLPTLTIGVTSDYDDANPLDLADAMPYTPPTGTTVTTLLVPVGGSPGDRLTRGSNNDLVWASPIVGGGGATTDASLLTSGILPAARIGSGSITDSKLASGTAFTSAERTKLTGIADGATANRSDAAVDTLLSAKAPLASPTFTGTVSGISKAMVGLGNVDNTADTAKPVSTAQQSAIAAAVAGVASPFIIDTNYASLEAALAAVPTGGVLEVQSAWSRSSSWTIDKACTVRFTKAGAFTMTSANVHGIIIDHDDVRIENAVITTPGPPALGTAQGIRVKELAASPLNNITIIGGEISGFARAGIDIENAKNVRVEGVYIHDVGYIGIEFLSVLGGKVLNNRIVNVTQPTGFVNSYGIAASRDYSVNANPQSQDILIQGNVIHDVPAWEGIDTHAGINIRILDNFIYNCTDGIAVIGGKNASAVNTYPPQHVTIRGNHIDGQVTDGTRGNGIVINGVAGSGGTSLAAAVGIVCSGNTIIRHGTDDVGDNRGAIDIKDTKGCIVSDNTIVEPAGKGINVYDTNIDAVVTGNTIIDLWLNAADNGTTAAVAVRGSYNTPIIANNTLMRGSKTATLVNHRGLYVSANGGATVRLGQNDFSAATTPLADSNTLTAFGLQSKKMGFSGKTPIAMPAANSTDIATMLQNFGLLPAGTTPLGSAANQPASAFATPADVAAVSSSPTFTPASATFVGMFPGPVSVGGSWSVGYDHFYPVVLPAAMTVDQLLFETTAPGGTGAVMRWAAYGQVNGLPDLTNLIKDFTGATPIATDDAAGNHTVSFSSVTLPRGLIYVSAVMQVANVALRIQANPSPPIVLASIGTPTISQAHYGYVRTGVTGALPTSGSMTANTLDQPPKLFFHTV